MSSPHVLAAVAIRDGTSPLRRSGKTCHMQWCADEFSQWQMSHKARVGGGGGNFLCRRSDEVQMDSSDESHREMDLSHGRCR